jgi:hypothetical protein
MDCQTKNKGKETLKVEPHKIGNTQLVLTNKNYILNYLTWCKNLNTYFSLGIMLSILLAYYKMSFINLSITFQGWYFNLYFPYGESEA